MVLRAEDRFTRELIGMLDREWGLDAVRDTLAAVDETDETPLPARDVERLAVAALQRSSPIASPPPLVARHRKHVLWRRRGLGLAGIGLLAAAVGPFVWSGEDSADLRFDTALHVLFEGGYSDQNRKAAFGHVFSSLTLAIQGLQAVAGEGELGGRARDALAAITRQIDTPSTQSMAMPFQDPTLEELVARLSAGEATAADIDRTVALACVGVRALHVSAARSAEFLRSAGTALGYLRRRAAPK